MLVIKLLYINIVKMEEKHNEENKTQLIKNLCYEMDTNKLMINDNQNNHYLCDIYGRKKIKFWESIDNI